MVAVEDTAAKNQNSMAQLHTVDLETADMVVVVVAAHYSDCCSS